MAIVLQKRVRDTLMDVTFLSHGTSPSTPEASASSTGATHKIRTTRFGTIEIEEDLVITLPEGLIGFEACKRFIVLRHDDTSVFRWLQSLDEPAAAFPIVEPGQFRRDYAPTISDSDARFLAIDANTPTLVFTIVSIPPGNPREMTANLLGPIVINGATRIAKQVIVLDDCYQTRHRIVDEMARSEKLSVAGSAVVDSAQAGETSPAAIQRPASAA